MPAVVFDAIVGGHPLNRMTVAGWSDDVQAAELLVGDAGSVLLPAHLAEAFAASDGSAVEPVVEFDTVLNATVRNILISDHPRWALSNGSWGTENRWAVRGGVIVGRMAWSDAASDELRAAVLQRLVDLEPYEAELDPVRTMIGLLRDRSDRSCSLDTFTTAIRASFRSLGFDRSKFVADVLLLASNADWTPPAELCRQATTALQEYFFPNWEGRESALAEDHAAQRADMFRISARHAAIPPAANV